MACKRCGSKFKTPVMREYPRFSVHPEGEELTRIGAQSSIYIEGLTFDETFLPVGKVMKISRTAAADLVKQGAPIWILT